MGRLFRRSLASKIPRKSANENPASVQVSNGTPAKLDGFQTAEFERLAEESGSKNIEKNDGSSQPDNSVLNDSESSGRVIKGGFDAMNQGVLLLTKLMTQALEAGDWETAEKFSEQLQRVIAIRTAGKKKVEQS